MNQSRPSIQSSWHRCWCFCHGKGLKSKKAGAKSGASLELAPDLAPATLWWKSLTCRTSKPVVKRLQSRTSSELVLAPIHHQGVKMYTYEVLWKQWTERHMNKYWRPFKANSNNCNKTWELSSPTLGYFSFCTHSGTSFQVLLYSIALF